MVDPIDTPVTIPDEFTVAIPVFPLLQVPPEVASFNVVLEPTHIVVEPVIAATVGTVSTLSNAKARAVQLNALETLYIIVTEPELTPVTIPVEELTVAIEVLLLNQKPPEVPSDKVVVPPIHSLVVPVIPSTVGSGLTVTFMVVVVVTVPFETWIINASEPLKPVVGV